MHDFTIHLKCPYKNCTGETLADGRAKITISVVCSKCKRVYCADLDTLKTFPAKAQRRRGRR